MSCRLMLSELAFIVLSAPSAFMTRPPLVRGRAENRGVLIEGGGELAGEVEGGRALPVRAQQLNGPDPRLKAESRAARNRLSGQFRHQRRLNGCGGGKTADRVDHGGDGRANLGVPAVEVLEELAECLLLLQVAELTGTERGNG